jgi:serine/threonine-protein kinase
LEIYWRYKRLGERAKPEQYLSRPPFRDHASAVERAFQACVLPAQTMLVTQADADAALPKQIGRYVIERQLGEGQFGRVLLAVDPQTERRVAIKTATSQVGEHLLAKREAMAAGKLEHEGIVTIYDVGRDAESGSTFVVMKFIDGVSLERRLERGPYELAEAVPLMLNLALAMAHAHQHDTFHLDLKPANILLDRSGRPWIADFGLAVQKKSIADHGTRGTPGYMSPSQWKGQAATATDDIWSLGAIFHEVLTLSLPCGSQEPTEPSLERALAELASDHRINSDVKNIYRKSLLPADEGYRSLDEMIADLRSLQQKVRSGPDADQRNQARQRERSAIMKLHEGQPEAAIRSLRESIAIYDVNAYANYLLGVAYLETTDVHAGVRALLHSRDLDRNSPWTHHILAEIFFLLGHGQWAAWHIKQTLSLAPTRRAYDLASRIPEVASGEIEEPASDIELSTEIESETKRRIGEAAKTVFSLDRAQRVKLRHWTSFLPPWRYLDRSPFLYSTALAVICCSLILLIQWADGSLSGERLYARAAQQIVIWSLIWTGMYFSFVVPRIVEATYHRLLPAITGWTESEFQAFYVSQSSHLLGRTCDKSLAETPMLAAIIANRWQILPAAMIFLMLIPYQYLCAGDDPAAWTLAKFARYTSYVLELYFLTWTLSLAIFGLAFIPRFRVVPTRFFLGMPEETSLKPIGTMYLRITCLFMIGYLLMLVQHYVFATFYYPLVNISYISLAFTVLLLGMVVSHFLVSFMISKVRTQKCVEYSYHLESAFEDAMRRPSRDAFRRFEEREQFMNRIRRLDVFGLGRIDTMTLTVIVTVFVLSTILHYVLAINDLWLFDLSSARDWVK